MGINQYMADGLDRAAGLAYTVERLRGQRRAAYAAYMNSGSVTDYMTLLSVKHRLAAVEDVLDRRLFNLWSLACELGIE